MRAVAIRRSLVFAVCAIGVGCLYLAPGAAPQYESSPPGDEPTTRPNGRSTAPVPPAGSSTAPGSGPRTQTGTERAPDPTDPAADADRTGGRTSSPATQTAGRHVGGAPTGADSDDREPPQPVREIKTESVTADRLGLSWAAARDNVRVVGYHVWLNGFEVASTAETQVSVPWFNDDTSTNVVQVKAVDAAGNESETSPSVLVERPDPEPSPSPSPSDSTQAPSADPEPTGTSESTTEPGGHAPQAEPTQSPTEGSKGTGE